MKKWLFTISLFIGLATNVSANSEENKIIYMLSSPRSLSTAFLKMMHYRGDFKTLNEPSVMLFYKRHFPEIHDVRKKSFTSYISIPNHLKEASENSPLFVKDVITYFYDLVEDCPPSFFAQQNVDWIFLLRDPADVLISLFRACKTKEGLFRYYPDFKALSSAVGMRESFNLFIKLKNSACNPPTLLFADQISKNPKRVIESFCTHYQIRFSPSHLTWKGDEADFLDIDFNNQGKLPPYVDSFFAATIKSTSFGRIGTCLLDEEGFPTFEELDDLELRSLFQAVYSENKVFYDKLLDSKDFHLI